MKKMGILYICTGPYVLFWEDFYKSFEKNFLPNTKKQYYVFTDTDKIYGEGNENITKYSLKNLPWPLITLFRFDTFLSIKEDLLVCDYLMFSNANMVCSTLITEEEFLPQKNEGTFIFYRTSWIL